MDLSPFDHHAQAAQGSKSTEVSEHTPYFKHIGLPCRDHCHEPSAPNDLPTAKWRTLGVSEQIRNATYHTTTHRRPMTWPSYLSGDRCDIRQSSLGVTSAD